MWFSTDVETYPSTLVEGMACDMFIAAICLSLLLKLPSYVLSMSTATLPAAPKPSDGRGALGVMCAETRAECGLKSIP